MSWFKKHTANKISDKAAGSIAGWLIKLQGGFAANMHKATGSWSQRQKKIFLGVVCLSFSTMSVTAIITSFTESERIATPAPVTIPRKIKEESTAIITKEEFIKIQRFKAGLDSATIKQRPGLMDSIRMVEELYYSNLK